MKNILLCFLLVFSCFGQSQTVQTTTYTRDLLKAADAATARSKLGVSSGGTVTSVGLTTQVNVLGVASSPITSSGTMTLFATNGTSGGVPYFINATNLSSSAALTANRLVIGGGAGTAPSVLGSLGTTTTLLHGNASGAPTFGAVSSNDLTSVDISQVVGRGTGTSGNVPKFSNTSGGLADSVLSESSGTIRATGAITSDSITTTNGVTSQGGLDAQGQVKLSGVITPTQITSNQNDYNPTSLSTSSLLRISSDAARDITGLQSSGGSVVVCLVNVGSFNITLKDESSSSFTTNRFGLSSDLILLPKQAITFRYSGVSARWLPWGGASVMDASSITSGTIGSARIGNGTTGTHTKWNGTSGLADTLVSESGTTVTANGSLTVNSNITVGATSSAAIGVPGLFIPRKTEASANYGNLSMGSAPWDGSTTGFFVGSSSGTVIAVNATNGFGGNLLDLQVAGVKKANITSGGALTTAGNIQVDGASAAFIGGTNTAAGVEWLRSGTTWKSRLGDNSTDAAITAAGITASGAVVPSANNTLALGTTTTGWTFFYGNAVATPATSTGQALAISSTAPSQQASTVAGPAVSITAGNATAGSSNAGAAAGGAVTITAGNAAQLTSGNAAGGAVTILGGTGIGTAAGTSDGGAITINGGVGGSSNTRGGAVTATSGAASSGGAGSGNLTIAVADVSVTTQTPGTLTIKGGAANNTSASGTVGGPVNITAQKGGVANGATGTGGAGGLLAVTIGAGGNSTGNTTGTGGDGGLYSVTGGVGGDATGAGGTHLGGNGSAVTITSGAGGSATGGSGTRTGGNSGNVTIGTGAVGTGATANGTPGAVIFKVGGTEYGRFETDGTVKLVSTIATYNNIATAGNGIPAIRASARSTAQTAAVASVATYTLPATDASFEVSANVLVTTSSAESFNVQVDFTSEDNVARTLTLPFTLLAGTQTATIASGNGAVPYAGIPLRIRCKASTSITVKTTGTFTGATYNVEGVIVRL